MRSRVGILALALLCGGARVARASNLADLLLLGGRTSVVLDTPTVEAFKNPAANLSDEEVERHASGDELFERKFTEDPSYPDHGLGPVYNNISCAGCHVRDGRGALPVLGHGDEWIRLGVHESIFLRISVEGSAPSFDAAGLWGAPRAVPGYSTQLFHVGSFGLRPDAPGTGQADVYVKLERSLFTYPDGTRVELRKPVFKIENPYDLTVDPATGAKKSRLWETDVRTSPRMTPPMIGLGLLEAVPEPSILRLASRDLSRWGIHGHPNWVLDLRKKMQGDPHPISLGRFGLKASTPSIEQQASGALNGDMGVTNPMFPVESIWQTPLFTRFKPDWSPVLEATQETTELLTFYSASLAVPSRRDIEDPSVRRGAQLFQTVGCTLCHHPDFVTGDHKIAAFAHQSIHPFTDFLLHDMGPGLADGRRDFQANGREWKTRALWGVGLTQVLNPRAGFLHDGRAMTLEEAVLWHDGEAARSRGLFARLSKEDRQAVLNFLKSL